MAEVTIVKVRRVLASATDGSLLPRLEVTYSNGGVRIVAEGDPLLTGYAGAIQGYSADDLTRLIDAERDRRIAGGIEYPPGSGRVIQTREQDQTNISQQMLRAVALLTIGTPEAWGGGRLWLDASGSNPLPLPTPESMIDLGLAVGDRKEFLIFRAYQLKVQALAGEAVDYTSDPAWA
jgi:hypothetical protein